MANLAIEIVCGDLRIVPETMADAENIYKYMGCDPQITKYTGWNPYQSLEMTMGKIEHDMNADDGSYSWVIKKGDEFIGTIGAYDYKPDESSIELGYSIASHFWGNGYAGACAKAVVSFLRSEPHIISIGAWSHKNNIASQKVLLGAGLAEVGVDDDNIIYELKKI